MKNKFLIAGCSLVLALASAGSAWAFDASDCTVPLPNANWHYNAVQITGPLFTNPGGNKFSTVTNICQAINPAGNSVDDKSYTFSTENVLVCQRVNGLTDEGAALGFTAGDCP